MDEDQWRGLALVVGAGGGIGNALADALARNWPSMQVIRCRRTVVDPSEWRVDLECDKSLSELRDRLSRQSLPLRLVINSSGRLHGLGLYPEKRLQQVQRQQLVESFGINAVGPLLLARAIEPFIQRSLPFHFASLSARVGSITDNRSGGWYAYRAAKAAQNQLLRTLSIEWGRKFPLTTVTLLHPGTTDTQLSRPFQQFISAENVFTAQRAAEYLLHLLMCQTPKQSGSFLAWDGQLVPW